jgi:hypothetical protein
VAFGNPAQTASLMAVLNGYRRLSYLSKDPAKVLNNEKEKEEISLSYVLSNVVISHPSFPPMAS